MGRARFFRTAKLDLRKAVFDSPRICVDVDVVEVPWSGFFDDDFCPLGSLSGVGVRGVTFDLERLSGHGNSVAETAEERVKSNMSGSVKRVFSLNAQSGLYKVKRVKL